MEISEDSLKKLVQKALTEIMRERMQLNTKNGGSEYMDALDAKDSPLNPGCRPCSLNYWEYRKQSR